MTASETRVREQILHAAAQLAGEGLIERTWGNISARVSDTQFLITPSGLAYEALHPEQLVLVNIADVSWEGTIKPSSEKGIHAGAYRLRPEVNFVIHTHQYYASVAGIEGRALTGFIHPLLGKRVPCASYGLPGTARLRRAVEAEMEAWPDCRAFLLRSHGALCLGRDMEDAFAAARALEEICETRVRDQLEDGKPLPVPPDLGTSFRRGDAFCLTRKGRSRFYPMTGVSLPPLFTRRSTGRGTSNILPTIHPMRHWPSALRTGGCGPIWMTWPRLPERTFSPYRRSRDESSGPSGAGTQCCYGAWESCAPGPARAMWMPSGP